MPEKILKAALMSAPMGLVIIDKRGVVRIANHAFRRFTGWDEQALMGKNIALVLAGNGPDFSDSAASYPWQQEVQCVSPAGTYLNLHLNIERLLDGEEESFLLSIFPAHGFSSAMLSAAGDQQQKLEILGTLAGEVAHDLNNILTGILGHVSFLKLVLEQEGTLDLSLQAIEDSARKSAGMTQRILEFVRGNVEKQSIVNFTNIITDAANLFEATLPATIKLSVRSCPEDSLIMGDEIQLSQLVMNLAVNAKDALSGDGVIDIGLVHENMAEPLNIESQTIPAGSYAHLIVADNGEGIKDEVRQHIFEPFFTTKAEKGTGLGLAIVFSVVRAHQGLVKVESEVGKGARFEVYLPLASAQKPKKTAKSLRKAVEKTDAHEKILVIDDEETVRIVVQKSLEHLGYSVDVASSGLDALEKYSNRLQEYNLVILDMMMPVLSGDEVFYRLRGMCANIGVLIASGYASDERVRAVLADGALGFIQKPFAVDELADEVRKCLIKNKN
ncbi:MAG: response regulator [Deltaproteobacteria bacterium]|nr:response regulator [Deltaproteobacteria bacterium]